MPCDGRRGRTSPLGAGAITNSGSKRVTVEETRNLVTGKSGDSRFFAISMRVGCLVGILACRALAIPAFPGAEGYGANALGGRSGDVYYVTSLSNDGPGSLRYGISNAQGPRTILFQVSGNIKLLSGLAIHAPRITIAGQTAPGDGICLQDYPVILDASDLIVRHIRTRLGTNALQQADAMTIAGGTNIMVDHCSASWSVDETLSPTYYTQNLTVQWTYITESLNNSIHKKGPHGYGSLIRPRADASYSFHHDLYAHHSSRNPRAGTYGANLLRLDFRNNLIYDWGIKAGYNYYTYENLALNYVSNYLIAGPATTCYSCAFDSVATNTLIYQSGNCFDVNKNGRVDGTDTGWAMFIGDHKKAEIPFDAPPVTTDAPEVAYERVLAQAGAMPWRRDAVDARVTETVRKQTGQIIDDVRQVGGWPALNSGTPQVDTDNDGMPDYWEEAVALNPNDPSDGNQIAGTGYTQLEEYLNWLADPHAVGSRNAPLDVDLRALNGNCGKHLTFKVTGGVNGTVTLLADHHTARFKPKKDFSGCASFAFTATDPETHSAFGPVDVRVLVRKP